MKKIKDNKAITLIALIITIIVLMILAGVSIAMLTGENGVITQAKKSKITSQLSSYKEQVEIYIAGKITENNDFQENSLTAGKTNLNYNTKSETETGNIKTVISNIDEKYMDKLEIIKGKLLINTKNKEEIEIAKKLGIEVNLYEIVNGVLISADANLLLLDDNGTLTIPSSATEIGEGAFSNLQNLKSIVIPGTVKKIGKKAFAFNSYLESVTIEEGVEIVEAQAFTECGNLKNVKLPESLLEIKTQAFYACGSIKSIKIPSKIKKIEAYTFCSCKQLENIELPNGLKTIDTYAFQLAGLTQISIPKTVTNIGMAFQNCDKLSVIELNGNTNYIYESGLLMPSSKNAILFVSQEYLKKSYTFKIPEGIVTFAVSISSNTNIKKIIFPASLTSINVNDLPSNLEQIEVEDGNTQYTSEDGYLYTDSGTTLAMCYLKENVIKPKEGILKIGSYAFYQEKSVQQIELPDSVQEIEAMAFMNCSALEKLKIGKNVSTIDPLFKYVSYSGTVEIDEKNPYYEIENNVLYTKGKKEIVAVLKSINGTFEIPQGVEKIGPQAFHNHYEMTEIIIPNTVKEISNSFKYCRQLTKVEIPSSVEKISAGAFSSSPQLKEIIIHKKNGSIEGSPWGCDAGVKAIKWQE